MPPDPFAPTEPFVPAPGTANPHAQTIFAFLIRSSRRPALQRLRFETADDDFVDVDRLVAPPDRPHLLVLHGLESSSRAGYVAAILRRAAARGWGALALNFRSCSGEPNRLARSYHSGETSDARFVIEKAKAMGITGPLFGVGFSLGGNVLLRLLAEDGEAAPLAAAATVSVPYDLLGCARALDDAGGLVAVYRIRFLRTLKAKALLKARRHPGLLDPDRIRAARGIEAFDDAVTAPLHGFSSAAHYYEECASATVLGRIRRPTLLVSADDDPMVPAASLPDDVGANRWLSVLRTARGGHVGFVAGTLRRPRFWAEAQVMTFLDGQLPST